MSYNKLVASKLRKLRNLKGLTQANIALELDLSERQYQRLESGSGDLSLDKLDKIG